MIFYIVVGMITAVINNHLLSKFLNFMESLFERRTGAGDQIPDERSGHVPDEIQNHTPLPPVTNRETNSSGLWRQRIDDSSHNGRPALPERESAPERTPDTYPKCPRCGCRNSRGQMQLITMDSTANKWRCYNGHLFSS